MNDTKTQLTKTSKESNLKAKATSPVKKTTKSVSKPTIKMAIKPATKTSTKPAIKSVVKPVNKPVSKVNKIASVSIEPKASAGESGKRSKIIDVKKQKLINLATAKAQEIISKNYQKVEKASQASNQESIENKDVKNKLKEFEVKKTLKMNLKKEDFVKLSKQQIREIFRNHAYPYNEKMSEKNYQAIVKDLHIELVKMQKWVKSSGQKIVIIFEGRDAAGKGGTIKRFLQHLNPRGARVVALEKPSEVERGQWYFQRYIAQLPTAGEIVFFDRSWYNRGGVEHVMDFCTSQEYLEFMRQTPEFERMLVRSGFHLIKLWFSVSRQEQRKRFISRSDSPLKQWKLSPIDQVSLEKWDEYTKAKEAMFFHTDTADAGWAVIKSDDKKRARLNAILHVLGLLPYPNKSDKVVHRTDPLIVGPASLVYEDK